MVFCNQESISYKHLNKRHNPYFNRWFSAIENCPTDELLNACHNPYFNRWFSAISMITETIKKLNKVTILILIDGFLQCL